MCFERDKGKEEKQRWMKRAGHTYDGLHGRSLAGEESGVSTRCLGAENTPPPRKTLNADP